MANSAKNRITNRSSCIFFFASFCAKKERYRLHKKKQRKICNSTRSLGEKTQGNYGAHKTKIDRPLWYT